KTNAIVEVYYDGDWHQIPVYTRDPIEITRGQEDELSRPGPSTCTLSIDNRTGAYSPRNPRSALYGKLGRNTPLRVRVGSDIRFTGEVEAWPVRWSVDGNDVWAPVTAHGIMRRLLAPGTDRPAHTP